MYEIKWIMWNILNLEIPILKVDIFYLIAFSEHSVFFVKKFKKSSFVITLLQ